MCFRLWLNILISITIIYNAHGQFIETGVTSPSPTGNGNAVALYNNIIYSVNGWTKNALYMISVSLEEPWINTTNISQPLCTDNLAYYGQTNIQIGNIIYGVPQYQYCGNSWKYDRLFRFNLDSNSYYNDYNFLPQKARYSCVTFIDTQIFVIGGYYLNKLVKTQIYNITSGGWGYGANLNIARDYAGCAAVPDSNLLYVFGGEDSDELDSIERYDVAGNSWTLLTGINQKLVTARQNTACFFWKPHDIIYCIGGIINIAISSTRLGTTERFSVSTETILPYDSSLDMITPLGAAKFIITNDNNLLVISGEIERLNLDSMGTEATSNPTQTTDNPTTNSPTTSNPTTQNPTFNPTVITSNPTLVSTNPTSVTANPTVITSNPTIVPTDQPTTSLSREATDSTYSYPFFIGVIIGVSLCLFQCN